MPREALVPEHPEYPRGVVAALGDRAPRPLTVSRPLPRARLSIAIVGARKPHPEAAAFARELAQALARRGVIVVSGGALGIDAAAHEGALDAGGVTICVAPNAPGAPSPKENAPLFDRIEASDGVMVWPFAPARRLTRPTSRFATACSSRSPTSSSWCRRADRSGSLHAANRAHEQGREVLIARPAAWGGVPFAGSRRRSRRARVRSTTSRRSSRISIDATTSRRLLKCRRLPARSAAGAAEAAAAPLRGMRRPPFQGHGKPPTRGRNCTFCGGCGRRHAATLLLTLALENVVVEGPGGFFRRT